MRTTTILASLLLLSLFTSAQNGLEKIIVEKYYVSDAKDANMFGGKLPPGSVTYRIFADMLPLYKFQAVYGIPGHELRITTTTLFFNNEDKGAIIPNVIPDRNLKNNTVMLDSWLSVGAASESNFGILKTDDDGVSTVVNADGALQNADKNAGIAVNVQDGLIFGMAPRVTVFGIDSLINIFNNRTIGSALITANGSWASLYGSMGIDSLNTNRVLLGQFTTDGDFSFELNIQIGTPYGSTENYVAKNPKGFEKQTSGLIYTSSLVESTSEKNQKHVKSR